MGALPALVVLLTIIVIFVATLRCGRARMRHGIKAPATSGHPAFERAYRIQMNTLEQSVLFLPTLYLAASLASSVWAGIFGLVWIIARIWYMAAYQKNPTARGNPFMLSLLAWGILFIFSLVGVLRLFLS